MIAVTRCLIVFYLILGLVLPKVSGVLLDLHPGVTTQVICTGTEMIILRIGPDGTPVKVTQSDEGPCVLADPTLADLRIDPPWIALARQFDTSFVPIVNPTSGIDRLAINPESHGPPRLS